MIRHCLVTTSTGMALVPLDPPLLPGDVEIDVTGLAEPETTHPLDEVAVEAFRRAARKP